MTTPRRLECLIALFLVLATGCCDAARAPTGRTTPVPCLAPGIAEPLQCAEVHVPEVRGTTKTRTIGLRVVIVPAVHRAAANDPWVELVGGPGNAATDFARQFVDEFTYIRQTHDVLLVDLRGTGGSNALYCAELALHQLSSLPPRFPAAEVDRCHARLSTRP